MKSRDFSILTKFYEITLFSEILTWVSGSKCVCNVYLCVRVGVCVCVCVCVCVWRGVEGGGGRDLA